MRGRNRKRFKSGHLVLFCIMLVVSGNCIPGFSQPSEYLLKAVFLEKFTRFIEWPEYAGFNSPGEPFIIGILGRNPFNVDLESVYANQKIKNRKVSILHLSGIDEMEKCHLVFISSSEKNRINRIIDEVRDKPVLTVSDEGFFSGKGVIINLFLSDNKIRFEIDEEAIYHAGLRISYLLLKEAVIVNPYREHQ
ncbi:YfiR family protein [bacterium]|nr:YfiR family protein [bacterium]